VLSHSSGPLYQGTNNNPFLGKQGADFILRNSAHLWLFKFNGSVLESMIFSAVVFFRRCSKYVFSGSIYHVGEWDYQYDENLVAQNSLPTYAVIEERDFEYSSEFGWREVGWSISLTDSKLLGQSLSEREINEIIQGQQITDLEIRLLQGGLLHD